MADTDAVYERIGLYDIDYQEANATTGSYFSDAVYEQVKQDLILSGYNEAMAETLLTSGGLRVESTLDPKIQAILNEEYADPSNYPENVKWYLNYALTIISPDGTKNNFSKENMMTWFKQNQNKNPPQTLHHIVYRMRHQVLNTGSSHQEACTHPVPC